MSDMSDQEIFSVLGCFMWVLATILFMGLAYHILQRVGVF